MSYCVYVGKNLTADGRAYLAGYGDEPSSHWLEIVPRKQHTAEAVVEVGVTPQAWMPGVRGEIPQVAETARHICVNYSFYRGVPAPITNGGVNEYGVAVRDVWSTSRQALIDMTPAEQSGPHYGDLARLVLERVRTAREGVEIIGELIAAHGYATYGGNSHFIADEHEGWVVIEFAGGVGLWVAQRVGPDEIRVSRPGYIDVIPTDFAQSSEVMGPPHLIRFAVEQGWFDPQSGEPFDVNQIYGDGLGRWEGVRWMEGEMRKRTADGGQITPQDMMWAVRTEKLTGDTAGYGQVVPLGGVSHGPLQLLWHTASGAVAAPFTPIFMGAADLPAEFKQHRYLTFEESWRFMDNRKGEAMRSRVPQQVEASRDAFRAVKRLMYLMLAHADDCLAEVHQLFERHEADLWGMAEGVVETAVVLLDAGKEDLAAQYLTYFCQTEMLKGLALVETVTDFVEAKVRLNAVTPDRERFVGPKQIW